MKKEISKIIKWSTSRHNEMRKDAVVNEIVAAFKDGGLWITAWKDGFDLPYLTRDIEPLNGQERLQYCLKEKEYSSGSFCEGSNMSRTATYYVNFEYKTICSVEESETTLYQF